MNFDEEPDDELDASAQCRSNDHDECDGTAIIGPSIQDVTKCECPCHEQKL
jgi:hypothetical protein